MAPSLTFLGAAGTVTGAKFLLDVGDARRRVLLERGLFQGLPALPQRNWAAPPLELSKLGAVLLSHAHIDHSGYLPRLAREGFAGPIFCSPGTADLLAIMLRGFERPPSATWAVHGEPEAAAALRDGVERELHWGGCGVAGDGARVEV